MAAEIEKGGVFFFAVDLQQERGDSCYLFVLVGRASARPGLNVI